MVSMVICEKPSQARNVKAAIGNQHGHIYAALGHLLRFELPHEVKADWKSWGYDVLAPEGRRFKYKPSEGGGKKEALDRIGQSLERATHVIIATDCDREGEGIGRELLHYFNYEGKVSRAMFNAEDKVSLTKAFDGLVPASEYDNLYEAFYARAACDQIANLTLTRAATKSLVEKGTKAIIGIGRVKTPTLGILCKREYEILNFVARDFYNVSMTVSGQNGEAVLWYRPSGSNRIFDRSLAAKIKSAAVSWTGSVSVDRKTKHQAPPKLYDLPSLQKRAGKWGWTAKKTLEVVQSLYEVHKITTYPRAETRYLPESQKSDAPILLDALKGLAAFEGLKEFSAKTRKVHFSDKGLKGAAHHAVIPNINMAHEFESTIANLKSDELRMFELIAKSYVAALAPNHIYDEAIIKADVKEDGLEIEFKQTGRITQDLGWKRILNETVPEKLDKELEEIETSLSPLVDGDVVRSTGAEVKTNTTKVPKRYSEGTLIDAMQNAHRFIEDEADRDRLKEAKGIGTPATRDGVIEGLKRQGLIVPKSKTIMPSGNGMKLYDLLIDVAPRLVDAGETAKMEFKLDAVQMGEIGADEIIKETIGETGSLVKELRGAQKLKIIIKPSPKLKKFAESLARSKKLTLPNGYKLDSRICKAFIDANYVKPVQEGPLSKYASDKQMVWIKKLVEEQEKIAPKGYPEKITKEAASRFLDKHFSKPKKKRRRRRS